MNIPLIKIIKRYLESITYNKEIIASTNQKLTPFEDFKKGFIKWRETTTTLPSGRHLGHHYFLFTPDGIQYSDDK